MPPETVHHQAYVELVGAHVVTATEPELERDDHPAERELANELIVFHTLTAGQFDGVAPHAHVKEIFQASALPIPRRHGFLVSRLCPVTMGACNHGAIKGLFQKGDRAGVHEMREMRECPIAEMSGYHGGTQSRRPVYINLGEDVPL